MKKIQNLDIDSCNRIILKEIYLWYYQIFSIIKTDLDISVDNIDSCISTFYKLLDLYYKILAEKPNSKKSGGSDLSLKSQDLEIVDAFIADLREQATIEIVE